MTLLVKYKCKHGNLWFWLNFKGIASRIYLTLQLIKHDIPLPLYLDELEHLFYLISLLQKQISNE